MALRGKYAHVMAGLAPAPVDQTYQDKVNAEKQKIGKRQPTEIARMYGVLRAQKEALAAQEGILNLQLAALTQLLIESHEHQEEGWGQYGVASNALRLPDGDTVRIQGEPYGQVTDKEAFRRWCIANGYESQLQIWPSTMNAIVKERCLSGEALPDGTEAFPKITVVYAEAKVDSD